MRTTRWLLDWTVGGRVLRIATEPVVIYDADGEAHVYQPGLVLDAPPVGAESVTVDIIEPPVSGPGWAELVSRGVQLERTAAVLRRHEDPQTLDEAEIVLTGALLGVEYGADDEPLTASLAADTLADTGIVPPGSWTIGPDSWPRTIRAAWTLDERAIGRMYPLVIGYPGRRDGATTAYDAYEASMVEAQAGAGDTLIVGGGRLGCTSVRVSCEEDALAAVMSTSVVQDKLGQHVTVVVGDNTFVPTKDFDLGKTYRIGHPSTGGGITRRGRVVRGLGEVVTTLLEEYSSIPVDSARMSEWGWWLDQIAIDTYIDTPISVWDWISRALLPLVDVMVRRSPDGLWLQPVRWDATAADAIGHITEGLDGDRAGRVRTRDPVKNRFEIRYSRSRGGPVDTTVLSGTPGRLRGEPGANADPRVLTSYLCARSEDVWGTVPDQPIETAALWSRASSLRVLQLRAMRYAWPKRQLQLTGCSSRWEPGDVVLYSDAGLHVADAVALVDEVTRGPTDTLLTLTLLDGPG